MKPKKPWICKHRTVWGGARPSAAVKKLSAKLCRTARVVLETKVKMPDSIPAGAESAGLPLRLAKLREALLPLHKALLASERTSYEAGFGRTLSPYQFLQLLTSDPWFAWLAPITHLLADVDALLDAKEPLTAPAVDVLLQKTKTLLTPSESGEGFSRQYDEVLQRDPDVLFAHVALAKVLRALAAK
jgi:hypothetical protein